jgi:PAS domain S-box-containing protein
MPFRLWPTVATLAQFFAMPKEPKQTNEELRLRLEEAEETIRAIRTGQVDAFVVSHGDGDEVFTLETADRPYRLFVESMRQGAVTLASDGTILFCNAYFANLLKTPLEQLTGASLRELIDEKDQPAYDEALVAGRGEAVLHCADRLTVPVDISVHTLPGDVGVRCVLVTDLTEQKHFEALKRNQAAVRESEARLRFIMDSMPQKIFTATPTGNVDYFNPVWTEFTGRTIEAIRNWGWTQFIHPDDVDENIRVWRHSIDTGEPFQFEHRFLRADSEYRWHICRASPVRDESGRVVMWIGSNTDIHEQKQTANKLRELAADLSDADRRKNEFLAMLAHELRNPLAPIRNAVEILRLTGDDEEAVKSASEMMSRQVDQMVRLVDDLLEVSRITRGKIELRKTRVDLASVVQLAVEAARALVQCMGHDLTVKLPAQPIYLEADSTRLAQIIGNLLNNACKFTEKGGAIELTVERENEATAKPATGDDGSAGASPSQHGIIRVRDTGIGIVAEELPRIFDMFRQVDTSLERSVSGLGIGLTLVKNLVELHGGTVQVRSEGVGKGSEFIVRLPIAVEPPSTAPPLAKRAVAPVAPLRVLVVDDNHDSAESLAMLFELTGHETRTVNDGLEAVEAAEKFRPDVVLLDIGLPKMNGYEVARRLRQHPWAKTVLLVALTGWGQDEDRQRSKAAGFDAHFVKPVDFAGLQDLLAHHRAT